MTTPATIVNQALDLLGVTGTIGDIEEGSEPARVALRWYEQTLHGLLRSAHWNFARKLSPLLLLNDASGQTAGVGTGTSDHDGGCPTCPAITSIPIRNGDGTNRVNGIVVGAVTVVCGPAGCAILPAGIGGLVSQFQGTKRARIQSIGY